MNPGDTVQIEAPDFDPDINRVYSPTTYEIPNKKLAQETVSAVPKTTDPEIDRSTSTTYNQQLASQDTDWLDTIPVQIPPLIDSQRIRD